MPVQGSPLAPVSATIVQAQSGPNGPIASQNPAPSHSKPEPIASENPVPPPTHIPPPTPQVEAPATVNVHTAVVPEMMPTPAPGAIKPPPHSAAVWGKTLEIAKKKLSDKSLALLDLTSLTSPSAEENIATVIKALNAIQEDDKKNRWGYTWHGKRVVIVEHLGKILKTAERYSKVVDTAIQHQPEVTALVWAGVKAILQVCVYFWRESTHQTNLNP